MSNSTQKLNSDLYDFITDYIVIIITYVIIVFVVT